MMSGCNSSYLFPSSCFLVGIPCLEELHCWIAIPFCTAYIIALVGNCIILFVVNAEESLHVPMYYFLCILSLVDLVLSNSTVPKILTIFWFNAREINFTACVLQMFLIHLFTGMESSVLLVMSFDRYVSICKPLRYENILTTNLIARLVVFVIVIRPLLFVTPFIFLVIRLKFGENNVISHTYCEHMGIVKLACVNIRINIAYGLYGGSFMVWAVLRLAEGVRWKAFSNLHFTHLCHPYVLRTSILLFGHGIAPQVHIFLANLYVLLPPMVTPIIYGVRTKQIQNRVLNMCNLYCHCN